MDGGRWLSTGGCLPVLAVHGPRFSPVHGENDGRVSSYSSYDLTMLITLL
jgi:hypothetical protein